MPFFQSPDAITFLGEGTTPIGFAPSLFLLAFYPLASFLSTNRFELRQTSSSGPQFTPRFFDLSALREKWFAGSQFECSPCVDQHVERCFPFFLCLFLVSSFHDDCRTSHRFVFAPFGGIPLIQPRHLSLFQYVVLSPPPPAYFSSPSRQPN